MLGQQSQTQSSLCKDHSTQWAHNWLTPPPGRPRAEPRPGMFDALREGFHPPFSGDPLVISYVSQRGAIFFFFFFSSAFMRCWRFPGRPESNSSLDPFRRCVASWSVSHSPPLRWLLPASGVNVSGRSDVRRFSCPLGLRQIPGGDGRLSGSVIHRQDKHTASD